MRIVLEELHYLLVGELVVDFDETIALLQVLQEFVCRNLIHGSQRLHAAKNFFLRNFDVLFLRNPLHEKREFQAVFRIANRGGINGVLFFLNRLARNTALGVLVSKLAEVTVTDDTIQ